VPDERRADSEDRGRRRRGDPEWAGQAVARGARQWVAAPGRLAVRWQIPLGAHRCRGSALVAAWLCLRRRGALAMGFAAYRLLPHETQRRCTMCSKAPRWGPARPSRPAPRHRRGLCFRTPRRSASHPAKLSVLSLDAHGSRISLADGELDVQVQHRPETSWRFEAGPFTVKVRGTEFHLAYAAQSGRLDLQMVTGVVEVQGPSNARVLTLRAGESLELFAGAEPKPMAPGLAHPPASAPALAPAPAEMLPAETAPPMVTPPAPRGTFNQPRHRVPSVDRSWTPPEAMAWASLIAQGDFAGVVKDAERRGLDVTLASASAAELTSLADAARYTRHNDLARQALLGLRGSFSRNGARQRCSVFPGPDGRNAGFLAGRGRDLVRDLPARIGPGSVRGRGAGPGDRSLSAHGSGAGEPGGTTLPGTISARDPSRTGQVSTTIRLQVISALVLGLFGLAPGRRGKSRRRRRAGEIGPPALVVVALPANANMAILEALNRLRGEATSVGFEVRFVETAANP
jgi:hypothetical protein